MINPQDVAEAKIALGGKLAAFRRVADMNQEALAKRVFLTRSSIANIEVGRQVSTRDFWQRCDEVLNAGGALVAAYERFRGIETLQRRQRISLSERPETELPINPRSALPRGNFVLDAVTDGGEPTEPQAATPVMASAVSASELAEVLSHLRDQWHALVKTDNLLGPRHALDGVRTQLMILSSLMSASRGNLRTEVVQLAAQYAESAAWLYEDGDDLQRAHAWTCRAMEWAYEADDSSLVAWTIYRRSCQSAALHNSAQAIGLAQAARRHEDELPRPMRAAIRVQEARGFAMDGDARTAQRLLDQAATWAADETSGDARAGHGSFCTDSYIEISRAACLAQLRQPRRAIVHYDAAIPRLAPVYRRDRAAALAGKAAAHCATREPDLAAVAAHAALPIARRAGSQRIVRQISTIGRQLAPHKEVPEVAALLQDLAEDSH